MASKRETLHLKKNPDFPPKPPAEEFDFNPSEARQIANETLDTLKQELYASGIAPSQVSSLWQEARLTHEKILNSLNEYRNATDPDEKKASIQTIKTETAKLKGEHEENLRWARQAMAEFSTKEKGTQRRKKDSLTGRFGDTLQDYMKTESMAYAMKQEGESTDPEASEDVEQEPDATPIHIDTVEEPAEHTFEVANENTVPVVEASTGDEPIVMVNPVLTKIAMGGKKPKKERKSVSEGGTVYKGKVFSEPEPWMEKKAAEPEAPDAGPEPVVIRGAPETRAELKHALRRSVEQIDEEIEAKRKIMESLKQTAAHKGFKETERAQAWNGGTVTGSIDDQIGTAEDELISLQKERSALRKATSTESANDNESGVARTAEPVPAAAPAAGVPTVAARDFGPNVTDLVAKRAERMQAKQQKGKRNWLRAAVAGLFGLTGGASANTVAAEKGKPVPAVAQAPKYPQAAIPGQLQGVHQNASSPNAAPTPIFVPRQEHAEKMAKHHPHHASHERSVDPDRSEEISAIYAKEIAEHGLKPGTDSPGSFAALRAELRAKKEAAHVPLAASVSSPAEHAVPETSVEKPVEASHAKPEAPAPVASEKAEKFFNKAHTFEIDPSKPAVYSYLTKDKKIVYQIYGGKGDDGLYAAQKFVQENPDKVARFQAWHADSVTGKVNYYTGAFGYMDGNLIPLTGDYPVPDPTSFTEKVDFTSAK